MFEEVGAAMKVIGPNDVLLFEVPVGTPEVVLRRMGERLSAVLGEKRYVVVSGVEVVVVKSHEAGE